MLKSTVATTGAQAGRPSLLASGSANFASVTPWEWPFAAWPAVSSKNRNDLIPAAAYWRISGAVAFLDGSWLTYMPHATAPQLLSCATVGLVQAKSTTMLMPKLPLRHDACGNAG